MNKKSEFDSFAEDYRLIHTKNIQGISGVDSSYFGRQKVQLIKKEWGGVEKKSNKICILDLGCGDGMNAIHFQKLFHQIKYFGIDISSASIQQAKKLEAKNIHFACYDGKKVPFQDESFDIILIACVLHHVPHAEHQELLKECQRVLKKHGSIYIFEHNPWNPVTRKIVKDCEFDKDAILVNKGKLIRIMQQAGFSTPKVSYIIFFPRKGIFQKFLWMEKFFMWIPLGGQYFVSGKKELVHKD